MDIIIRSLYCLCHFDHVTIIGHPENVIVTFGVLVKFLFEIFSYQPETPTLCRVGLPVSRVTITLLARVHWLRKCILYSVVVGICFFVLDNDTDAATPSTQISRVLLSWWLLNVKRPRTGLRLVPKLCRNMNARTIEALRDNFTESVQEDSICLKVDFLNYIPRCPSHGGRRRYREHHHSGRTWKETEGIPG